MRFPKTFGFWQIFSCMGLVVLLLLTVLYGLRPRTFDERLEKAEKFWKQKRYEEAISLYLKLADQEPQHPKVPEILLNVAEIYHLSLGQIEKALQVYQLIPVRYPVTTHALKSYASKAEIYFGSDQYDKALKEYQNILENFPDLSEREAVELKLGICHLKLKQFEAARREFAWLIEHRPQSSLADQVLFQSANSYFLDGRPDQAIPIYQSLLKNFPKSSLVDETKFNLADSYEDLAEFDKALSLYEELRSSYPNPKVIELKIQRNKERKLEAEARKQKILEEKKPESRPLPLGSSLSKKVRETIEDIRKNYR